MRIIKEGKKGSKLPKFECKKCGCEFECNVDEYWTDTTMILTSYPAQYSVYANCPSCHKICHTTVRAELNGASMTCNSDSIVFKKTVLGEGESL